MSGVEVTRRNHARARHRALRAVLAFLVLAVLGTGGAAYAAYRYDLSNAGRLLPGVTISGIDVGGMTRAEAVVAVERSVRAVLDRTLSVHAGEDQWMLTLQELGVTGRIAQAVNRALAVSDSLSWVSRTYHRLTGNPVDHRSIDLSNRYRQGPVRAVVTRISDELYRSARNAAITLEDGEVVFRRARTGRTLDAHTAVQQIVTALRSRQGEVRLPLEPIRPEITRDNLGKTITVDLTTNTLRLYDGFHVVRTYDVGTAMGGFSTPPRTWTIVDKRENPPWYNPDPDGWGAGLPLTIPWGSEQPARDAGALPRCAGDPDPRHARYRLRGRVRLSRLHPDADVGGRGPVAARARRDPGARLRRSPVGDRRGPRDAGDLIGRLRSFRRASRRR